MSDPTPRLVRAWLDTLHSGVAEFDRDWPAACGPALRLPDGAPGIVVQEPASPVAVGRSYGYAAGAPGEIWFVLPLRPGSEVDPARDRVFVAGEFNGWIAAAGNADWELKAVEVDGEQVFVWKGAATRVMGPGVRRFKFVTGEQIWLHIPEGAPNANRDEKGNVNRVIDPVRMGRHLWQFRLSRPADLSRPMGVIEGPSGRSVPLEPGQFFFDLATDLGMGARAMGASTVFRLFAPRATAVVLFVGDKVTGRGEAMRFPLQRRDDEHGAVGVWELELDRNLHGWYYWYSVDGLPRGSQGFNPDIDVLDPYALAAVNRNGPGIILDKARLARRTHPFKTPAWQDLVIAEAHVRDLSALAPSGASAEERLGFVGLRKWVENVHFYLHNLGVNCVELQPVHEFDNKTREEYHWGYMPVSWFAPASAYSMAPRDASGVRELQDLVEAFHRRGMAVVLDVVFNHVGVPEHLARVDRLYYFEQDSAGALANWSGCGNDVRASAGMARRMIIDSMIHMIETYGVDGFRLDLAELLGLDVLREIETAVKRIKPNVILIAEPWSFRGHIAGALRDTGWASWNDGYRDTVRAFVRGQAPSDRMEYFLRGSPWYFAKWPAQTVNYMESHDDMTFIDVVTENARGDGFAPTPNDVARVRLSAALIFMSVGIPMLSAGEDFIRSKRGVNNTYLRGDLNALDYERLYRHLGTHAYFSDWISFRLGPRGRILRHFSRATEGFFRFFKTQSGPAFAVLLNADRSMAGERLLFAINPTLGDVQVPIEADVAWSGVWRQLADHERFIPPGSRAATRPVEPILKVPALGCMLWSAP